MNRYHAYNPRGVLLIILISAVVLAFHPNSALCQDIHFSQYFANPLSFNPANTGFFDGSYRLGINHKQQWPWAIDGKFLNYNSSAAYADFSFLDKKINDTDWAGIGLNFINDQAGDGNLTANKAAISMAYHKGLDEMHRHFLSFGIQLMYVHRRIDFNALYFNNQWVDRVGFDLSLPNNEGLSIQNTGYLDFGIGVQGKNQVNDQWGLVYGASLIHINRPTESFYRQNNRIGLRYIIHSTLDYQVNEQIQIQGSFYYSRQKTAQELVFGSLGKIRLKQTSGKRSSYLHFGAVYRFQDALAPIFGYQYHKTRLLLNYDINLSQLSKASRGNGGFELSLIQIGVFKGKKNYAYKNHCPSF